jgi:hypothetical protein
MGTIKLKLLVSIDNWDRYTEEWDINPLEAIITNSNNNWYVKTNKDIADYLINNNMAELTNN